MSQPSVTSMARVKSRLSVQEHGLTAYDHVRDAGPVKRQSQPGEKSLVDLHSARSKSDRVFQSEKQIGFVEFPERTRFVIQCVQDRILLRQVKAIAREDASFKASVVFGSLIIL